MLLRIVNRGANIQVQDLSDSFPSHVMALYEDMLSESLDRHRRSGGAEGKFVPW